MKSIVEFLINKPLRKYNGGFIDLGLPSKTLWADCNLGANNPEDVGNYYQWGSTTPINEGEPSWDTYIFCKNGFITKYNEKDKKTTLDNIDNAAYKEDNTWDIPTKEQYEELIKYTDVDIITKENKKLAILTSKNNKNKLIIPFGGFFKSGLIKNTIFSARLWSKNCGDDDEEAFYYKIRNGHKSLSDTIQICSSLKIWGQNIRPVLVKKN